MENSAAEPASAPTTVTEAMSRMDALIESAPKRLRQSATFTRRHLHLIAVSTVSDMAKAAGVAPSAYMRFCQALGFSGYSDLQTLFRAQFTAFRPDYDTRLAQLRTDLAEDAGTLLADFAESGHKSLLSLGNSVPTSDLTRAATLLSSARTIHVVGLRRAYAVAANVVYLLNKLDLPAALHSVVGQQDESLTITDDDVVFAITFAPFSDETVALARRGAERGARVLGLSDSDTCPIKDFADPLLIARENEIGGFRALNAAITLSTALAVAAAAARQQD
ncbi:MurR/RpiR family transcriptional regulator [Notoacmeibacter ruber]|uniref:MurR/RpiR family transcriptional regulator n=1 Tax=Notoacmeibacter ruber TaxID=2670375 RepID=A0A3L7J414_9HYPH|nr:MurR/RpiR family transcriptional regulator [Notoacmeibacter ruber]RLQ85210.1 MurR/RpiR family transcriptional regulator [Notoacmeibacter ruber]